MTQKKIYIYIYIYIYLSFIFSNRKAFAKTLNIFNLFSMFSNVFKISFIYDNILCSIILYINNHFLKQPQKQVNENNWNIFFENSLFLEQFFKKSFCCEKN